MFSAERKTLTPLGRAGHRIASSFAGVKLTQIFALLVALTVILPPGLELARSDSTFLSPLKIELIPFDASVQSRHLLSAQFSEARLSQNRVSLGLAARPFTVPPIRHDRHLCVTSEFLHRSPAHTLALLRAPPLA